MKIRAETVNRFGKKGATRLKCTLDRKLSYSCGLNHLGDGNFYIIVATRYVKLLGKRSGDVVMFEITEDQSPLGVEIPGVLEALLEQDEDAKRIFGAMTDGKKRSLIYLIKRIKDIDKQIQKALTFLNEQKSGVKKSGSLRRQT